MKRYHLILIAFISLVTQLYGCAGNIGLWKERYENTKKEGTSDAYLKFTDLTCYDFIGYPSLFSTAKQQIDYHNTVHTYHAEAKRKINDMFVRYNIKTLEIRSGYSNLEGWQGGDGPYGAFDTPLYWSRGKIYHEKIMGLLISNLEEKGYNVKVGKPILLRYLLHGDSWYIEVNQAEERKVEKANRSIGRYGEIADILECIDNIDVDGILTLTVQACYAQDPPHLLRGGTGHDLEDLVVEYTIYDLRTRKRVMAGTNQGCGSAGFTERSKRERAITPWHLVWGGPGCAVPVPGEPVFAIGPQYIESEDDFCVRVVKQVLVDLPAAAQ